MARKKDRSDALREQKRHVVFATKLHRLRMQAGVTQEALAFGAGIDVSYASQLECGHKRPSLDVATRIADVLGHHLLRVVSLDEFREDAPK